MYSNIWNYNKIETSYFYNTDLQCVKESMNKHQSRQYNLTNSIPYFYLSTDYGDSF